MYPEDLKKNPYAKELKKQITINLSPIVITYFKKEAENTGVPYQTLINLYLMDCVKSEKKNYGCGNRTRFFCVYPNVQTPPL